MTSLEEFEEILIKCRVGTPVESFEVFRDLIDMQADVILDSWLKTKMGVVKGVELSHEEDKT
jgi:hypothetical protein